MKNKLNNWLIISLLLLTSLFYAQTKGISYQAVIYKPGSKVIPGVGPATVPLTNTKICLRFTFIDAVGSSEYQETITVTTDDYGIVNTVIGLGNQTGGYATSFGTVSWNTNEKTLLTELDISTACSNFEEISKQNLATAPFALHAITSGNITGIAAIANGGTGASTVSGAKLNLGLSNVDNTSDLDKPISIATRAVLNVKANAADVTASLALKENTSNKSTITTLGTSDILFPTQNAVKTYVDTSIASATIADADATTKGKIQLAGDLSGTAAAPTVPGLALKENAANKSAITSLGTSDVLFPTQNAVKTYVDSSIASATIADADATTKGKIQLAGDLAGSAAAPTVPGLALKENAANKSTITTLGTSDILFPTQNAVKTYVDNATGAITTLNDGKIYIGDATNQATQVTPTGDVTINNLGVTAIGTAKVVTGMLATDAVETVKIKNAAVTNAKLDKTNIPLSGFAAAAADVDLGSNKLINVTDPTDAQDAATKNYVDTATGAITTLNDGRIYIGDATNQAIQVTPTGDVTITNAGVTAIGTEKVLEGMLAPNAVTTVKILDSNVTSNKLANDAVTSAKILNSTIVVDDLADNAVETAKIKNGAVTVAKLPAGATATTFLRGDGTWTTPEFVTPITSITESTTLDATHSIIRIFTISGDITVTLPTPADAINRIYRVIKIGTDMNKIIFSEIIKTHSNGDAFTEVNIPGPYEIQSDGNSWYLIN